MDGEMKWISVKDELPEYSELVLVTAVKEWETGRIDYLVDIADRRFTNRDGHYWMNAHDNIKSWQVTHWMPLPEPPQQ